LPRRLEVAHETLYRYEILSKLGPKSVFSVKPFRYKSKRIMAKIVAKVDLYQLSKTMLKHVAYQTTLSETN